MDPVLVPVPQELIDELQLDPQQLRQALILGLEHLRAGRSQKSAPSKSAVLSALLETGRVRPLNPALVAPYEPSPPPPRQEPPTLDGPPVSEIIIAQRRS
jgi:hypothetical protein